MPFDPNIAAIRFGTGLSPNVSPISGMSAILDELSDGDAPAAQFPIRDFAQWGRQFRLHREARSLERANRGTETGQAARQEIRAIRRETREWQAEALRHSLLRAIQAPVGFRERLEWFWADHFTVRGQGPVLREAVSSFVADAIRPNISGSFADMLKAAVTHPMMLRYLNQTSSVGPNSNAVRPGRGLNENLAREVLELHTLGVDAPYRQGDVTEFALLLTGLGTGVEQSFRFHPSFAEPGAEVVLGSAYGGETADVNDIYAVLDDLSIYPATARHIARKLAVHFVSDSPSEALVSYIADRFFVTNGDLPDVYEALLSHPDAWNPEAQKVKRPLEFVASALRALHPDTSRLLRADAAKTRQYIWAPMQLMGQAWEYPNGPDGWPESVSAWTTPQGIAARIQWAITIPRVLKPDLPDPRAFAETALGSQMNSAVRFAAEGAQTKWEGVGLILASPSFQRR
ncbi:DUF1800 domain-containing protein [Cochlodiniinecator piscidefendens]|uniref:DUF1800 domain-containing protein n=1 Tax=Cochlodiniinecator piscidefendens TaxID=2715756 RepID=UPI00140CF95F|nr:DUF1800 domain-containing protein [Cochlodiniinecator piscidefendens]